MTPGLPGSAPASASCRSGGGSGSRPSTACRLTTPTSSSAGARTRPTTSTRSPRRRGSEARQQLDPAGCPPRVVKEQKITLAEFPVRPDALADLINRVSRKEVNTNQGREAFGKMIETGDPVDAIIKAGGCRMVSDRDAIAAAVDAALAANPKALEDLKGARRSPTP
ncbi:MAG: hypothetical protein U0835_23075 [Isosphaeraceae bacterium]